MRASLVLLIALARTASADSPTFLETHGIEIEVPAGWSVTNKPNATEIMPTKYKGRGIEIVELAKPLTKQLVLDVLVAAHADKPTAKEGQRDGTPIVVAQARIAVKDKGMVDVDVVAVSNASHNTVMLMSFIKGDMDPLLREANDKLLLSARVAGPRITLSFAKPAIGNGYPDDVVKLLGAMGTGMDGLFRFPRALPIVVKDCGVVNAFYSQSAHSITMCHELWDDTYALFKKAAVGDVAKLTKGAVMFVFFHEFGHALVGELGLAITGKSEDVADEVATLILGQAHQFGHDTALAAASWFQVMSKDPDYKSPFYDEHSFNKQRMVSIACLLYGSNQTEYAPVMKDLGIPEARQKLCVTDFGDRMKAWNSLMAPHMKKPKK